MRRGGIFASRLPPTRAANGLAGRPYAVAPSLLINHIAPREERRIAGGWTRDGAVQNRIDDAVLAARPRMPTGEGGAIL